MTRSQLSDSEISSRVFQNPSYFFAFGFGSGLLPLIPGTWGTLAAIPIYLILVHLSPVYYGLVVLLLFLFGVWICEMVTNDLGIDDYSGIVWDEIVGYLITMFAAPATPVWIITGFILFRVFDISKIPPINYIDRKVKGGLGVMSDDVLAGIFALIVMQALIWGFGG